LANRDTAESGKFRRPVNGRYPTTYAAARVENPQCAEGKSSTSVRNAAVRPRARVLRTDKHDVRDVFMMRVAASILDVRNIEMNGRTFIPRAGA